MKITSIKQQVKNPERVSVFIDGRYSFSLSLDELLTQKIKNDQEIDKAQLKKLKKISEDGKLKMRALAWVLGRPHSVREFRDYMSRKKADPDLTEQFVEDFKSKNYLNDENFASWLVELRQRGGKSNRQIQAELYKKGIMRDIAEKVLQESGGNEMERLKSLIVKKSSSSRYRNDPLKLKQYLMRQGFGYDLINEALKKN